MAGENTPMRYGTGTDSDVGQQFRTNYYNRMALEEAVKDQYFTPLADSLTMPKNMGKSIVQYHYMPVLDDRNDNDQGIDAAGSVIADGNLYGSSKDIGTITSKLPTLGEAGGRVNRVGYTRLTIEASIQKLGYFDEWTRESYAFDTDAELQMHIRRERVVAASQISEAILQKDLLAGAGVTIFAGTAQQDTEITGEGASVSVIDYADLKLLDRTLNDNRTPRQTEVLEGALMTDTKVVGGGRLMYIGSEIQSLFEKMTDWHGNPAFIEVQHYAGQQARRGEIGTVGNFRVIVVPEMLHWAGAGATATSAGANYRSTDVAGTDKYDVFPALVVGDKAFTTIGFQTDGQNTKFRILIKPPGKEMADRTNPYGEVGLASILWYYGTMILRPERLALVKTVAEV